MVRVSQKTVLCHVNDIYEVSNYIAQIQRNQTKTKNHGVTGFLSSVEWVEDEQYSLFSVVFSQKTGLCAVNNIYDMDFLI